MFYIDEEYEYLLNEEYIYNEAYDYLIENYDPEYSDDLNDYFYEDAFYEDAAIAGMYDALYDYYSEAFDYLTENALTDRLNAAAGTDERVTDLDDEIKRLQRKKNKTDYEKKELANLHKQRNQLTGAASVKKDYYATKHDKDKNSMASFGAQSRQVYDNQFKNVSKRQAAAALDKFNKDSDERSTATTQQSRDAAKKREMIANGKATSKIAAATGMTRDEVEAAKKKNQDQQQRLQQKNSNREKDPEKALEDRIKAQTTHTPKGKPITHANQTSTHSGELAEFKENRSKQANTNLEGAKKSGNKQKIKTAETKADHYNRSKNNISTKRDEFSGEVLGQKKENRRNGNPGQDAGNQVVAKRNAEGRTSPILKGVETKTREEAERINSRAIAAAEEPKKTTPAPTPSAPTPSAPTPSAPTPKTDTNLPSNKVAKSTENKTDEKSGNKHTGAMIAGAAGAAAITTGIVAGKKVYDKKQYEKWVAENPRKRSKVSYEEWKAMQKAKKSLKESLGYYCEDYDYSDLLEFNEQFYEAIYESFDDIDEYDMEEIRYYTEMYEEMDMDYFEDYYEDYYGL
jgi:hypothetical protein